MTGTPYYCSQKDLDFHANKVFHSRNKLPFVIPLEATAQMLIHNDITRPMIHQECDALDRLCYAVREAEQGRWYPDLPIKAFQDLDTVFFGGCLQGNVKVSWSSSQTNAHIARRIEADGHLLGFTEHALYYGVKNRAQCCIVLNADAILLDANGTGYWAFDSMMTTLLHEMCHAYDWVRCPYQGGDGHDVHFESRISVLHQRVGQMLGLKAIDEGEPYVQNHVLRPLPRVNQETRWEVVINCACGNAYCDGDGTAPIKSSAQSGSRRRRWDLGFSGGSRRNGDGGRNGSSSNELCFGRECAVM